MNFTEIIQKIAQEHDTTPADVEFEMKKAIKIAVTSKPKLWTKYGFTSKNPPTPEQFIAIIGHQIISGESKKTN